MSETVEVKQTNFKEMLSTINKLNQQQVQDIFIPSLGKEVSFNPLSIKQQKSILSSGVDVDIESMAFSNTMNGIILDNCLNKNIKILAVDRPLILLQLRQKSLGNNLKITDEDEIEHTIDLESHISKQRESGIHVKTTFDIESSGIKIECLTPDLQTDTKFNKQFTKAVKKATNNKLKLNDVIGDIYVFEMVKYIKSVGVMDDMFVVDQTTQASHLVNLFESLPINVSSTLADAIKVSREIETASITCDTLPEGVSIPIDASIFTGDN